VSVSATATAKKLLIIVGALLLLGYLFLTRSLWFSELERQAKVGRDRLNKPIDLARADTIIWKIKGDDWKYTGEFRVGLVFDRLSDIQPAAYRKESMLLKLKVDAYAITYKPTGMGTRIEGFRAPRLIRNFYYTTDAPLSSEARIWESWGKSIELGLCGVERYPFEDTYVAVEIVQPDPVLAKANPRLEIVGEHDYAVYEHLPMLRIFRDFVLMFLVLCVIGLAYGAVKQV
jgi:hypothetical protein